MGNLISARKVGWNLLWVGSMEGLGSPYFNVKGRKKCNFLWPIGL